MKHILILEDEQRNANRLVRLLKEIGLKHVSTARW